MKRPKALRPILRRWKSLAETIADPNYELTAEDFAPIYSLYRELQRAGHRFDVMTAALMQQLHVQSLATVDCIEDEEYSIGDVERDTDDGNNPPPEWRETRLNDRMYITQANRRLSTSK